MHLSSPSPLRLGIVGCGGIAQVVHLPILMKLEHVEIVALCDIDIRKASILAERFQVKHFYNDIEEMFSKCHLEAAFILTPNNMHLPMSLIALKNGAHVFIEQPAARSSQEALKIAESALKYERNVMVGMHSRFRPDVLTIKSFLDKDTIGEVFFVKADWLQARFQSVKQPWWFNRNISGGGVLMDLGLQLIDTSWWLTNRPELRSAKAHRYQINPDIDVEDFCSFHLEFSSGLQLSCHISWNFPIEHDCFQAEIFGSNGSCRLNPLRIEKLDNGRVVDITPELLRKSRVVYRRPYENILTHFINYLSGKEKKLGSTIHDAVKVLQMIEAIYESLRTNRELILSKNH